MLPACKCPARTAYVGAVVSVVEGYLTSICIVMWHNVSFVLCLLPPVICLFVCEYILITVQVDRYFSYLLFDSEHLVVVKLTLSIFVGWPSKW